MGYVSGMKTKHPGLDYTTDPTALEDFFAGIPVPGKKGRGIRSSKVEAPRTSVTHPIEVAWVPTGLLGALGVTFCPGKKDLYGMRAAWDRDLGLDVSQLRYVHGTHVLVPLIEDHELPLLRVPLLPEYARAVGMEVRRFPIPDMGIPASRKRFLALVDDLRARIAAGDKVVVHCRGGLGRAGTLAAAILIRGGVRPDDAIRTVRSVRPGAVETHSQEDFLRRLSAPKGVSGGVQ